jgi:crotonobetainyl-CoA:carnitine CoA-transferase CaiB-like acyl-CoA transferase
LEGFRVVDTTAVLAGPTAGRTLAEFGAEVIKVNNPWEQGAGYRWQVHRYHTDVNRGKESILIDLKTPEGLNVLGRLIDTSDAFLQNMRLGVAERLGIGYEQIRARKPDIVYMSISAFGYGGEWQYRPGYEPVAQSFSGMQARSGGGANRAGGQPYAVNDYCTGLLGAFAVGLGLFHRLRTGEGQNVETSLAHAATFLQLPYMQVYEGKTWDEPAGPEAKGWSPLQRLYRAADGWFFLGASPAQIESVSKVVGIALEELPHKDLEAALSKGFGALTTGDCLARLTAAGIGAYALGITAGDLMRDLWNIDHGLCVTQRYKEGTMVTTIGPPWRLSRTPVSPRHIVSPPGADAEAVLAKIGMADRLAELVEKRVVVLE